MSASPAMPTLVLAVHAVVGVLVFGGLVVAIAGALRGWRWTKACAWRVPHLLVTLGLWLRSSCGIPCPFSVWEDSLRVAPANPHSVTPLEGALRLLSFRNLDAASFNRAMMAFALVTLLLFVGQFVAARYVTPAASDRLGS